MNQLTLSASHRLAGAVFTLFFAMNCQASLMDCTSVPGIDRNLQGECVLADNHLLTLSPIIISVVDKAPPAPLVRTGFQVNAPQIANPILDSLALMIFFAGLLGVILIRAKSCNSK